MNHNEGFKLMWYACECGHTERIWNSRNGVTPFGLACPSCGKPSLLHVAWGGDNYAPKHKCHKGQRFFRDGTPDEAAEIMARRLDSMQEEYPSSPDEYAEMVQAAREGKMSEFQKGWPMIDRAEKKS